MRGCCGSAPDRESGLWITGLIRRSLNDNIISLDKSSLRFVASARYGPADELTLEASFVQCASVATLLRHCERIFDDDIDPLRSGAEVLDLSAVTQTCRHHCGARCRVR
jgi:hypothetical protein